MAVKPTVAFTWSTDANFGSGPASGNPTKVLPLGFPANLQGYIPGLAVVAEHENHLFNNLGDWTGWLFAGSFTGADDAHILETDVNGNFVIGGSQHTFGGDGNFTYQYFRAKQSGTGAIFTGRTEYHGQAGRDESGGNPNNDGGTIERFGGAAGLGGGGAAGNPGPVVDAFPRSGVPTSRSTRVETYGREILTTGDGIVTVFSEPIISINRSVVIVEAYVSGVESAGLGRSSHKKIAAFYNLAGTVIAEIITTAPTAFEAGPTAANDILINTDGTDVRVQIDHQVGVQDWAWSAFVECHIRNV